MDHRWQCRKVRRSRRGSAPARKEEWHEDEERCHGPAALGRHHQAHRPARWIDDLELEVQVEAEANQYIPFPLDEVSLDFCVVGPSSSSVGDLDVLIAASRREKVQDIQGLAEAAGLKPVVVDVESYASRLATARLIESLPNKGVGTIVALFEVGALTTSMQVMRDQEVL